MTAWLKMAQRAIDDLGSIRQMLAELLELARSQR
jgi:hypothetical protein